MKTREELQAEYDKEHAAGDTKLTYNEWAARKIMAAIKPKAPDKKPVAPSKKAKPDTPPEKPAKKSKASGGKEPKKPEPAPADGPLVDEKGKSLLPPPVMPKVDLGNLEKDEPLEDLTPEQFDDDTVLASGLTMRQEMYCRYLVADKKRNGTEAARRAGYSPLTAHVASSRLLKNLKVRAFIKDLMTPIHYKLELTAERLLEEYRNMALYNTADFLQKDELGMIKTDSDGLPIPDFSGVTPEMMTGMAGLEITILPAQEEGEPNPLKVKWKAGDKKAAMDVLAKRMGLVKEQIELSGEVKVSGDTTDLAKRVAFLLRAAAARDKKEDETPASPQET